MCSLSYCGSVGHNLRGEMESCECAPGVELGCAAGEHVPPSIRIQEQVSHPRIPSTDDDKVAQRSRIPLSQPLQPVAALGVGAA